MANHHAVHAVHELAKDSQLILIKFFARAIDLRQLVMSI